MESKEPSNYVIVVEKDARVRGPLKTAIIRITEDEDGVLFFNQLGAAFEELKKIIDDGNEVDLMITDVFISDKFNIFGLIRELERVPKFWNIPLLVYTNGSDEEMLARIKKNVAHLPYRVMPKTMKSKVVGDAIIGLLEYRMENRYYLDLEIKIASMAKLGEDTLIPSTLKMIDQRAEKYFKFVSKAKVEHLKGRLYYEFWKQKSAELEPLLGQLERFAPSDKEFEKIRQEIKNLSKDTSEFLNNAERFFLATYRKNPSFWEVLHSLYTLYIDQNKLDEAKKYLSALIKIFPEQSKYFYRMGKIQELEGNFSSAVGNYHSAWKQLLEEGVTGYDIKNIMDIVDSTLEASRAIMNEVGVSNFNDEVKDSSSMANGLMRMLKQVNAVTRKALVNLAKEAPKDPEVFNKIGLTYRRAGDYGTAVKAYISALKLDKSDYRIRMNLAVSLALAGSWSEAGIELEKVRQLIVEREDEAVITALIDTVSRQDGGSLSKMLV